MIYFTADTHFDHANIIRFCNRPFATVGEMNEALIANWNRKVHGNDTVYILGDMFFRTTDSAFRANDYTTYTTFYILNGHVFYKKNW